jgi:hypothetical protein
MTVYNLEKTFSGRWKGYFSLFLMRAPKKERRKMDNWAALLANSY